jgi:hypothetical protein
MTTAYKVLGQAIPAANTNTDLYTVPESNAAVVSSITVCNQAATTGKFRIGVRPGGIGISSNSYISYDTSIPANDTIILTLGMTLEANTVVTVYSFATASLSYNLFGSEIY